jgi:hypothetical protein
MSRVAKKRLSAAQAGTAAAKPSASNRNARDARSSKAEAGRGRGQAKERQPGEPLANQRHEAFAQAYAVTNNGAEAYRRATGKSNNAHVNCQAFLANPSIQERITEIRGENAKQVRKSRENVVEWLADVIDEKRVVTKEQLKAAEILNKMCGWNEPDKVESTMEIRIIE